MNWADMPSLALKWDQGTRKVWSASLSNFKLYVTGDESAAQWSIFDPAPIAGGPADGPENAKQAAETWLRGHLHDLLRELQPPQWAAWPVIPPAPWVCR